jgi:hypothetical protein
MPQYSPPVCLVVSSGVLQNSSDVFGIIDPDTGGAASFSVQLSANGALPVTHWGCRTQMEVESLQHLRNDSTTQFKAYVDQKAAQFGRQPIGSVTAFKNNVQISADDADFWQFVAGLGLQRI